MPHELIPLSMLNAFVYCQRRFFYEYVVETALIKEKLGYGIIFGWEAA